MEQARDSLRMQSVETQRWRLRAARRWFYVAACRNGSSWLIEAAVRATVCVDRLRRAAIVYAESSLLRDRHSSGEKSMNFQILSLQKVGGGTTRQSGEAAEQTIRYKPTKRSACHRTRQPPKRRSDIAATAQRPRCDNTVASPRAAAHNRLRTDLTMKGNTIMQRRIYGNSIRPGRLVLAVALLWVTWFAGPAMAIEIVCHRGANEHAPENTYAAAQLCIDWGIDYVEIDVRTSKDGVMYILHDLSVNRTTNGSGLLRSLTSEQVDRLDAGSWFDEKFAGERVPRLKPYLRWIKGKAKVYFDVKDADLKELIDLVYEVGLENDCFFWFGNPKMVEEFRRLDQQLSLKVNASSPAEVAEAHERYGANIIEVGLDRMSEELREACRARGIKLMIYHPQKDAEAFRRVIEWDVDMINLNHGDLFQQVQREVEAQRAAGE